MSRTHRIDNVGMHVVSGAHRSYGKCPRCDKVKPMHWVSKIKFLCYTCLKETNAQPYYPQLEKEAKSSPPILRKSSSTHKELPHPVHKETSPPTNKKALKRFERSKRGAIYKSYP